MNKGELMKLVYGNKERSNGIDTAIPKEYWDGKFGYKEYSPLTAEKGNKYIKLIEDTAVWGFISMVDGELKNSPIKKGDLLKPAGWITPAKHSRGNIFDGTDSWGFYGPDYLK